MGGPSREGSYCCSKFHHDVQRRLAPPHSEHRSENLAQNRRSQSRNTCLYVNQSSHDTITLRTEIPIRGGGLGWLRREGEGKFLLQTRSGLLLEGGVYFFLF